MQSKVEICLVDTSTLPKLTGAQTEALLNKVKQGDKNAREEFIYSNLRLVLSVVGRFNNRGENVDDLFQVGCIGLIKAIDHFDTSHMVKFSTYAVPMIIGELRRYLRDNSQIRVSRSMRDLAYKALQAKNKLMSNNMKDPTIAEIAKELDVPEADVIYALDSIADPISLFEPIYNDSGDAIYIMDQVRDDKESEQIWMNNIALSEGMKKLSIREKEILKLRFYDGKTQMEVATSIGISQAQVSRLEKSALKHMKKYI